MRYAILSMSFIVIAVMALLVACVPVVPTSNETNNTAAPAGPTQTTPAAADAPKVPEKVVPVPKTPEPKAAFTVEGTEGELIQLRPEAVDPDGDTVTYTFTKPFDANGRWQTSIGDEGTYMVVVGASDKSSTTTENVRVIVHRANRPPVIDCSPIAVNEGETIDLHKSCRITDEDDEDVVVSYGGWMNSWRYTTNFNDAGTHAITITASDKRNNQVQHTVTKELQVVVRNVNRAPTFDDKFPATINAVENDIITLPKSLVTDPDGDKVIVTYSTPFGQDGVWRTKLGDAGTYDVDVVASDGQLTMKRTVHIVVALLNTPPVLKPIPDITVKEGETVKLPIVATDREGDKLTISITGWMTSDTKKTDYGDAGEYTSKITVSDGTFETSQVVHITVQHVNRPPVFVVPA